jgi:membrane fusion protein (multidrug efflux system)
MGSPQSIEPAAITAQTAIGVAAGSNGTAAAGALDTAPARRKDVKEDVSMLANRRSILVAVAMTATLSTACEKPVAVAPPPPPAVSVATVVQQDVPVYLDLVGQTQGFQDVDIRARVEGFLETVNFREGSFVRKGDLLYQIDPKPLQASLAQANAARATGEADLATARARLAKANNDVARYTPLAAKQAVSQRELDDARALQDAARSQVDAAGSQVDAAKAAVEKATLDLGYVRISSPINGLVGTTLVKPGSLVGRGESTLLTTISVIDPIIVRVAATEADYLRVVKRDPGRAGQQPRNSGIQLTLADGMVHPHTGTVGPVERAVNAATGTLGLQVLFPNPDNVLRPGQYGRVRLLLDTNVGALLVPQRAVQELQNLHSVAVVGPDNKVAFRNVKVGPRVDTLWVIEEGLKPGEQVVAEGLQALRDGMTVQTKPVATGTAGVAGEAK